MRNIALVLASALALAACDRGAVDPTVSRAAATDPRPLLDRIETAELVPSGDGAILRATGVAPVQGYWDGALVEVEEGDPGVLSYAFRAEPPADPARVSTERSREVAVALRLTPRDLAGIREIRVAGAGNARALRP